MGTNCRGRCRSTSYGVTVDGDHSSKLITRTERNQVKLAFGVPGRIHHCSFVDETLKLDHS